MKFDTEIYRSYVQTVNLEGRYGFIKNLGPTKWEGRDILFHFSDHRGAINNGTTTTFGPFFASTQYAIPDAFVEVVFQVEIKAKGPQAFRWCLAKTWDSAKPIPLVTGRLKEGFVTGTKCFTFATAEGKPGVFLVHLGNRRPVSFENGVAYLDMKEIPGQPDPCRFAKKGDRIVFQIQPGKKGPLAIPWTFEEDWAAAQWELEKARRSSI